MALRTRTVERAFTPRTTTLATGTTLAASTRHDFAAITVDLRPNSSRTPKSVEVQLSWRDAHAAATSNVVGVRIGIKLGAVLFNDVDIIPTALANTGDHEWNMETRDVTSYFVTNFGAADTQTCQVGVAVSTATASIVNNITAKLIITYEFDDTAATKAIKTARIPIQSHHALLTAAQQEIGTVGGTNNAPANQIPQLTGVGGYLPEAGVVIHGAWFEVWSQDAGAATTDFSLFYQIDAAAEVNHVTVEQGLNTAVSFYTHIPYDTGTFLPSAAHAFKLRSDLASRFDAAGAVLHVTYEHDVGAGGSTSLVSVMYAIGDGEHAGFLGSTAVADCDVMACGLLIPESSPVLKQSGVLLSIESPSGGTLRAIAGTAPERSYTITALVEAGGHYLVHRCDVGAGAWSLSQGVNTLPLKLYSTTAASVQLRGAVLFLNYHCTVGGDGEFAQNHTTRWSVADKILTGGATTQFEHATASQRTPSIPEARYWLSRVSIESIVRVSQAGYAIRACAERLAGEGLADGWETALLRFVVGDSEVSTALFWSDCSKIWNRSPGVSGALNIETARKWRTYINLAANAWVSSLWVTYHSMSTLCDGNVTIDGVAVGAGVAVDLYDATGKIDSDVTDAGGQFADAYAYNPTAPVWAVCEVAGAPARPGRSLAALPGSGFDIEINTTAGGGGGAVYPVVGDSPVVRVIE